MIRSRAGTDLDPTVWPAFDAAALPARWRSTFLARRQAVELYVANVAVTQIEQRTGVDRRQLYRLLDHCVAPHEDGLVFGWRGLVPYARVDDYVRTARVQLSRDGTGSGAAGAFGLLLQAHPILAAWIVERVRDKRIALDQISTDLGLRTRLRGLKHVHTDFLLQCRKLGLTAADYPFNTERMGIRSLASALRTECLHSFARGARLAGATHLKGMPRDARAAPTAVQALDVVEFDGHRLDVRLKIVVRDPLGFEQEFEIERIWLLVIIDVYSRAVLGYHVSLTSRAPATGASLASIWPRRLPAATGWPTTRQCCGLPSSSCTTGTACPASSRYRWSRSRAPWKSFSRTASFATRRNIGRMTLPRFHVQQVKQPEGCVPW